MRYIFTLWLLLLALVLPAHAQVKASLVSSVSSVAPGARFPVALRLEHDAHWHTYWQNPGTGLATTIQWTLSPGGSAGSIEWPAPILMRDSEGAVSGHGYEGDLLLPVDITLPSDLAVGSTITLTADASWLMCKEACVPGSQKLSLVLPVATQAVTDSTWAPRIAAARAAVPLAQNLYPLHAYKDKGAIVLDVLDKSAAAPSSALGALHFFPLDETVDYEKPQLEEAAPAGGRRLRLTRAPGNDSLAAGTLRGVLRAEKTWNLDAKPQAILIDLPILDTPAPSAIAVASSAGVWATLGLALLGGMILNLMPCVFPVIGIKILGFVQQSGSERRKVVMHGLIFSAGVLISFWILAVGLLLLRSGGASLGWGFQLQSPAFVYALTVVMLVFGLNMSGLFEFGLSATTVGSGLQMKQGYLGSFFTGVLATLVATPCSAPFLAPALGAALAFPPLLSVLVFTMIAVGLSLPYLTLSVFPSLIRLLPRPGAWMESFKQAMAFPLYATVGFLIWVLAGQIEEAQLLNLLLGLVCVAAALWDFGKHVQLARTGANILSKARVLLLLGVGLWIAWPVSPASTDLKWEPWSAARLQDLRKDGRTVYVDFTARWCATCQTNKKVVFGSAELRSLLQKKNVALLKADWTNSDPLITAELARWNRSAVPFNLVYRPLEDEPQILPEILSPGIVRDAISPPK